MPGIMQAYWEINDLWATLRYLFRVVGAENFAYEDLVWGQKIFCPDQFYFPGFPSTKKARMASISGSAVLELVKMT